jgi:hypothetical protein
MLRDIFAHTPRLPSVASCDRVRCILADAGKTRGNSGIRPSVLSSGEYEGGKLADLRLLEGSSVLATPSESFRTAVLTGESSADFRAFVEQGNLDLTLCSQSDQLKFFEVRKGTSERLTHLDVSLLCVRSGSGEFSRS